MNDEQTAQLSSKWTIPTYAQKMLWVESQSGSTQAEGENGLFTLDVPERVVTLRWGGEEGPLLTQLAWQPDNLDWDGSVRIGGMVDAIHMAAWPGLDMAIAIVHIGGQPLLPKTVPFQPATARQRMPYPEPDWFDGFDEETEFGYTTWLVSEESSLYMLLHDAMSSKLPVHVYGQLADEDQGWHPYIALPILLQAVTVFSP
ncbi:hypothetical protein G4Y79_23840 [Phototrophicus methaneseepsis]|uniref:Uncharacterized protein n=1 Tax=Phototrophicus methaneseepsis TaxID=2710758 RepID=A0A7S8IEQ1_9CHLR|nr:hypothetical protein [Phototrophicus methaneseepsis]QPC82679.1 hypothetical protein G4Y79_23840 [Phototrophicus methaneseepsis]